MVPVPGKEVAKEIEAGGRWILKAMSRMLRLATEQEKHAALIEKQATEIKAQAAEIATLREALQALKAREDVVEARAETAATRAASISVADLARRIGHLEARRDGDR